ncbi:cytochrome b5 domain-containing protein RLF [Brachypodium distachyon]|uniref:Cytochrome b5 heme-binding domain-containing protein n=1 Tax=Brachypodium distachyon TaxID=15368 RepID=I1IZ50_BRADI|nr:cytochrome b5 domain-containing protein RLF [Brachypodium distachyon]KQJ83301.1 hypothetical protein BRADI_5g14190v3 [Brachypodium distachyon]|eukprot:XP_003580032.1 cytochrome b5 domain-containing protein RLF [Brachypodium distachyon]
MADGDSSDFTFCKVDYAGNDDHLESPNSIPVESMALEDGADISKPKKIQDDRQTDNPFTDGRSSSISSRVNSLSLQDSNIKEPVAPKSSRESVQLNVPPEPKPTKKPAARAKVPFEKGFSPMDWLKLTRTHPDLAGLKGQTNRRLISLEEVKQHKTGDCIWTVLKGRVYNIGPYMKFHPGGVDMLMKAAGKDCTALFNKYHAWVNAEFLLEKCLVGFLDPSE